MKKNATTDISIIIPAYNAEKTIEKCLESVITQTKKEFEIIVINDGSEDNTEKIIKKFNDERLKYFKNKNQGIGKTRNFGIDKVTGKYIMFLDSDDYLAKDALEKLFTKAEEEKLDLVINDFYRVQKDKCQLEKLPSFENTTLKETPSLLEKVNLSPWNKLYKTTLIKNNNLKFLENLKYEDAPFVAFALFYAKKIGKIDEALNYYVVHSNSETTLRDEKIFDILKVIDIIRTKLKSSNYLKDSLDKLTVRMITNYTIQQRMQKDKKVGMHFIDEAFNYLQKEVPDYKNDKYYKDRGILRKTIEKNKTLSKIYCSLYKIKTNSLKDNLVSLFFFVFFLLFSFIIVNDFLNQNYREIKIKPLVMLFYLTIYFASNFLIFKFIKNKIKHNKIFNISLFLILIIIQLIFAYIFIAYGKKWDFGTIVTATIGALDKTLPIGSNYYLKVHPNNIGIVLILKIWYSIFNVFKINNYYFLGIILNIIIIDLGVYYLYKILKLLFSKEKVTYFILFTIFFTPLITYVPIFYTDTMSIAFTIGGIYYFIKPALNNKKKNIYAIFSGLLIGIGTCIKFTCLIVMIALIVYTIFKDGKDKFIIEIKKLGIISVCCIIPYLALKLYTNHTFNQKEMNELSFPYTHYIMMGLEGAGGYNEVDQEFTGKYVGIDAKKEANIKKIKSRIEKQLRTDTFLKHIADKTVYVWGDGTFFAPRKLTRDPKYNYKIKDYILNEDKNQLYKVIAQCQLLFMLIFIIIGCLCRNYLTKSQKNLQLLLNITIFGVYLFFLVWEARSRYIVNFIPILLLSSYLGVEGLINFMKHKEEVYENKIIS